MTMQQEYGGGIVAGQADKAYKRENKVFLQNEQTNHIQVVVKE